MVIVVIISIISCASDQRVRQTFLPGSPLPQFPLPDHFFICLLQSLLFCPHYLFGVIVPHFLIISLDSQMILALASVFLIVQSIASLDNFIVNWDNPSNPSKTNPLIFELLISDNPVQHVKHPFSWSQTWLHHHENLHPLQIWNANIPPWVLGFLSSSYLFKQYSSQNIRSLGHWTRWVFIFPHLPPVFTSSTTYKQKSVIVITASINYILSLFLHCTLLAKRKFQMSTTIRFLTVHSWVVECSWRKLYNQAYCFYFNLITLCLKWALNTTWQFFRVSPLSSVPNIWDDCFIYYPLLSYLNSLTHC